MAAPPTPPPEPAPTPSLPSTADAAPYVPVSWTAVAAMAVAELFVVVLALMAWGARGSKSPLIEPLLLVLPAAAIVLSFAARRVIRASEGTRTGVLFGINLPSAAWWQAVVLGLGYLTYVAAIEFSINREAKAEVERWVGSVTQIEPGGAYEDPNLARAFHRTRVPAERRTITPEDARGMEGRYGNEFAGFRQCDLVRLVMRNPGQCQFVAGGLRDWSFKPGGVECMSGGTLTCPEGVFPLQIPLRAVDGGGKKEAAVRQWQVVLTSPSAGFIRGDQARLTPYGWFVATLQAQGGTVGRRFVQTAADRTARPYAYLAFADPAADPAFRPFTEAGGMARFAGLGVPGGIAWQTPPEVYAEIARRLLRQPGGEAPTPEQQKAFSDAWSTTGIAPAGSRLRDNPAVNDILVFTPNAIEVRVPVEIPLSSGKKDEAARGRVVMACTDPDALATAAQLRDAADPAAATPRPPGDLPAKAYDWRLVRIETTMKPVSNAPQQTNPTLGGPDEDDL